MVSNLSCTATRDAVLSTGNTGREGVQSLISLEPNVAPELSEAGLGRRASMGAKGVTGRVRVDSRMRKEGMIGRVCLVFISVTGLFFSYTLRNSCR